MHRIALWSFAVFLVAVVIYGSAVALWVSEHLGLSWVPGATGSDALSHTLFLVAGVLFVLSFAGGFLDLVVIHNLMCARTGIRHDDLSGASISVGMTAYNDEDAVGPAVADFVGYPGVDEVVVIDNNCTDSTAEVARAHGARVVEEVQQGYGHACMKALAEASHADVIVLVEGDQTFAAADLKKLLAYLENVDMVLGTRTTRELLEKDTQIDWLMNPANQVVAKLIQLRFWGSRFSDVGCTYRVIRKDAYRKIKDSLRVGGMHFSPHMTVEALKAGLKVIEVPVTFRKRAGTSKGVGSRKLRAAWVALNMIWTIVFR